MVGGPVIRSPFVPRPLPPPSPPPPPPSPPSPSPSLTLPAALVSLNRINEITGILRNTAYHTSAICYMLIVVTT
ncbi:hypothetical protein HZH68_001237 [Vespula germanica]|uniref:Uncharacterized protein n=1 Tax=Vespula germanica TaxID=30212 RepID=A0A834NVQ4_VESGE|nr:hypothetical protein HZH68_001237 [Vespula germanica]